MGYDASGVLNLDGEGVPDLFLVSSISLLVFLIADLGFTGFRGGDLGLIVTAFLFVITLISYIALSERVILSEGHILDGVLGFWIGILALNLGNILGGIELSFLSTATESYLSGILGTGQQFVIPIVNVIFAPLGETFLIFGLTAGIWQIVKRTRIKEYNPAIVTLVLGFLPSVIFAGLHGAGRGSGFLLFAFIMNMLWTAIIVYSDYGKISSRWIPGSLGLVAGLHVGFNSSSFGGFLKFLNLMIEAVGTNFNRSGIAILGFFVITGLGAALRLYQLLGDRF